MQRASIILTVLSSLLLFAGCGKQPSSQSTTSTPSTSAKKIKIGFLVKQPEEPWFQNEWKFAKKCAATNGFDLVTIGATDGEKVLAGIDNLGAQGAQGFIICTPDVKLGPAIVSKAKSYNMKVMAVDDRFIGSDGKSFMTDVSYMGISARKIGEMVGNALAAEMKKRGWKPEDCGACAVTYDQLDTGKQRTDGATAMLIAAGLPKERVFAAPEKTTDVEGGLNAATILLTQHPEVKQWLIYALNDEGVMGAVRAMENSGRFNEKTVIGVGIGGNSCIVEFKKEKPTGFYSTVLISPLRHGYETTELMYKWIKDGVEPPKETFTDGILVTRETFAQVMKEQGLTE